MNYLIWILTAVLLILSLIKSKAKTREALIRATKKFNSIISLFLIVMIGFALLVTYISPQFIQDYIGRDSGLRGIGISLGLGSVSVMPGFAAFPLCAALKKVGIPLYILGAFSLSLMNVGIVTFPLEKRFLGFSVALTRNILCLLICILATLIFKIVFGE